MYTYQGNDNDCGFTCLKILLANLNKDRNYLSMPNPFSKKRISLAQLCLEAKKYNVILRAYKFSRFEDVFSEKAPFLAVVKNGSSHMVYIRKIKRSSIVIYDPSQGRIKMSRLSFLKTFHGIILNAINFTATSCPHKRRATMPLVQRIVTIAFQALAIATLFIGFYFANNEMPFVISFSLFLTAFLLQMASYLFLIASMKKFDQKYLKSCNGGDYCTNKERMTLLQEYKKAYFSAPLEMVSSFVSMLVFIVLLIINSPMNVLVIGIILIGYFAYAYFSDRRISKKKRTLAKKEEMFLRGAPVEQNTLITETYRLGTSINARRILIFVISLVSSVILMVFSDEFALNFCLLYSFFYIFLLDSYDKFLHGLLNNESRKRLESRFCDLST
ncbi:MAG: cysteine peptidase family C39 domain-containing protein [Bacilli bacterium]|jgi:hypothetical protein